MQASTDYSSKARELFVAAEAQKEPLLRAGFAGMARAYLLLAERAKAASAPVKTDEDTAVDA